MGGVDARTVRVQIKVTIGQLAQFGEASHQRQALHWVTRDVFEHGPHEVAHVKKSKIREAQHLGGDPLRSGSGATRKVLQAGRAGDVDAAPDTVDPCAAGVWHDGACGAQH